MRRTTLLALALLAAAGILAAASPARAQMPTLDPAGRPSSAPSGGGDSAGATGGYATPTVAAPAAAPAGQPGETGDSSGGAGGFYHTDGLVEGSDVGDQDDQQGVSGGPVPELHVVRRGDTLWDICFLYFNNPWEWPKVWSFNPTITNPHWIYPGDQVRLYPKGLGPVSALSDKPVANADPEGPPSAPLQATPARSFGVDLRQVAFVDKEKLDVDGVLVGAVEEKMLLSTGDAVYIDYEGPNKKGKPPTVGKRYAIYTERKQVAHPTTGAAIGSYVEILGELEIVSVKKGKHARAVITDAIDVIERGARVGPLETQFRTVEPVANSVDVQGTIVAMLNQDELIGTGQVVFLDLGTAAGVKVGNRMYVVRRGDAYDPSMGATGGIGQDDRKFPARAIGEVMIVNTGKNASVALVTLSVQEMGPGDLVMMRKQAEAE
jgi:LysM domain-containing protein